MKRKANGKGKRISYLSARATQIEKTRITKSVNKAKKSGDWLSLENILPNTAYSKKSGYERIHNHIIKIRSDNFHITGIGSNMDKVVIVQGLDKWITRAINPNPTYYESHLGVTHIDNIDHYQPLTGLTLIAWIGDIINPDGSIQHSTPKPTTTNKTAKKQIRSTPEKSVSRSPVYSPLSHNKGKGKVKAPRGSLRDIALKELGKKVAS